MHETHLRDHVQLPVDLGFPHTHETSFKGICPHRLTKLRNLLKQSIKIQLHKRHYNTKLHQLKLKDKH